MRKRQKKNTIHVYTSTRVEESKAVWRLYNFLVLMSMAVMDAFIHVNFPETGYLLVIGSILGVDVPALVRRFLSKKI